MFEGCGLDVLQVMEVAGRSVAAFIRQEEPWSLTHPLRITALCGPGGNGGDGLVAARYLHGWGADVDIVLAVAIDENTIAGHQLDIARRLGISVMERPASTIRSQKQPDLIVDALLGFSGRGDPRGNFAGLIRWANGQAASIVAIDLPSGLDGRTGEIADPCISAAVTVTLGLPKTGLLNEMSRPQVGKLVVADIGIPTVAYEVAGVIPPAIRWEGDWIALM